MHRQKCLKMIVMVVVVTQFFKLHFINDGSKNLFLILEKYFNWNKNVKRGIYSTKLRNFYVVLHFLAFNHVDFPRKFVRLFHGKNSSKRCVFHCLVVDNFNFTRKSLKIMLSLNFYQILPSKNLQVGKVSTFYGFMTLLTFRPPEPRGLFSAMVLALQNSLLGSKMFNLRFQSLSKNLSCDWLMLPWWRFTGRMARALEMTMGQKLAMMPMTTANQSCWDTVCYLFVL